MDAELDQAVAAPPVPRGAARSPAIGGNDWHSFVQAPLVIADASAARWGETTDVVVVGFGGAGACAALEARAQGADVLVVDRFTGGGATAGSGGVVYAGGGTAYQKAAGFDDTVDDMFAYLKLETQGIVSDATLRRFCEESRANLEWLRSHGVPFSASHYAEKTIYPPEGKFLYYAGNELLPRVKAISKPAPRGHRAVGRGIFCGAVLHRALAESARGKGVRILQHAPAVRLVTDTHGAVLGVQVRRLKPESAAYTAHDKAIRRIDAYLRFVPPRVKKLNGDLLAMEAQGEPVLIRARGGVILSAGGFAFNEDMLRQYASCYAEGFPVGSAGCDGSGIRLGQSVGGAVRALDSVSATRAISPPPEMVQGIVVDGRARRFVEEDAYGGSLGRAVAEHGATKTYLIIDARIRRAAIRLALRFGPGWLIMSFPMLRTLVMNCVGAADACGLARRIGLDAAVLEATLARYHEGVAAGSDEFGKNPHNLKPLRGRLYAIEISTRNKFTTCMIITMGGLAVDEESGNVLRDDGTRIAGLYAAGRSAVGIPSHFYVSGTSIADCVFSGRRAGLSAALAATGVERASRRMETKCA